MSATCPVDVAGLDRRQLEAFVATLGGERFRAQQIFQWLYRRGVTGFEDMTDLPLAFRERLQASAVVTTPEVDRADRSSDGTAKFRLRLSDGRLIESVFIPDTPAQTLCISSQVGCAMGCTFCLTGKMGWTRHLSAGEIVGQVRVLVREVGLADSAFNIVLMGMGEPLHNYDATMQALRILTDRAGLALPARRITLSTVGVVPALERLASEEVMPNLAVSLHATTNEQRDLLVPLNRKYPIESLMGACRRFPVKRRERITFEYVLLSGVNDTDADARRLVKLLGGLRSKVNLIPLNEAPGIPYERPSPQQVDRFAAVLAERGITVMVRKSRGRDIRAACGQLIVEGSASPAQQLAGLMRNHSTTAY